MASNQVLAMGSRLGVYSTLEMVNFVRPVAPTRFANPPRGTRELEWKVCNHVIGLERKQSP